MQILDSRAMSLAHFPLEKNANNVVEIEAGVMQKTEWCCKILIKNFEQQNQGGCKYIPLHLPAGAHAQWDATVNISLHL